MVLAFVWLIAVVSLHKAFALFELGDLKVRAQVLAVMLAVGMGPTQVAVELNLAEDPVAFLSSIVGNYCLSPP